jgi:hypothetical protein
MNSNVALQKVDTTTPTQTPKLGKKALLTSLLLWIKQGFHIKVAMVKRVILLTDEEFNSVNRELM